MNFGQDCNFGEDMDTTTASSKADEKAKYWNAGFTTAHAEERSKCCPCKDFFTLPEKIQRHIHFTFRAQEDLVQHTHTNGNRAETQEAFRDASHR